MKKKVYVPSAIRQNTETNPWNKFYKMILDKREQKVDYKRRYTP